LSTRIDVEGKEPSLEAANESGKLETFKRFLEAAPPGQVQTVRDVVYLHVVRKVWEFKLPDLILFCGSSTCGGERTFSGSSESYFPQERVPTTKSLAYRCRNCNRSEKIFAVKILRDEQGATAEVTKIGEWPPFGPKVPRRVLELLGEDKDLFLKGRRAENQGMGIGAFAYYRRVLENQKARLVGQIAEVARRIGTRQDIIEKLEVAGQHWQFTRSVDEIKEVIPPQLLIRGHNPLVLLHGALSLGIHGATDEKCLELATSIRVVLTELADRIGQALKDEVELQKAVTSLLHAKSDSELAEEEGGGS
jgi:hypothetical protein